MRNPDRLLLPGFTPAELEAFEEATQYDFVAHVPDNTDENQDNLEALTNAADIYQNIDDHSDDWENIRGAASNNTRNQLRFQQINDLLNGPAGLERMLHNANRTINTERTRRPGFFTLDRWRGNRANADSQIILDEQRELVRMQTALQRLPEGHPDRVVLESDITLQEQQIKNAEEAFRESALALPVNIAALPPDAEYNVLVAGPPVATQLARLEYLQRQIDTLKVEQVNLQEVSNTERDVSREGRGEQLQKEQDLRAQLTLLIDALHEVDNPALPPAIFTAIEGINVSHFTMNDLEIALSGFNITIPGSSISALPPGLSTMNPIDYTMNPIDYRDTRTVFDWISDDIHETRFHHTTLQEYNGRVTPDRALDALLQYRFRDNPNFVDVFKQSLLGNEQGIVQDWVKKDPRARRGLQWLLSHVPLLGTVFRA